jgi:hypothetical protein
LFQRVLFNKVEEIHVSLQRKPSVLESGASSTLFAVRKELVFEINTSCKSIFWRSSKAQVAPNWPILLSWRNTCIYRNKTISVKVRSMYHIVSFENWVNFRKEYFLQVRCFKVQIWSLCSKKAYSAGLRKQVFFQENHLW